jgi:hypothetical protein
VYIKVIGSKLVLHRVIRGVMDSGVSLCGLSVFHLAATCPHNTFYHIYTGCFKKSFTTILISNAGALAVAVLGTTVPRA